MTPTCLSCGAPLPLDAVSWGALECGRCLRPSNPAGRPPVLAGARRVTLYVDGETDRIVAARAARDGVSWAEALRRIVRGAASSPDEARRRAIEEVRDAIHSEARTRRWDETEATAIVICADVVIDGLLSSS